MEKYTTLAKIDKQKDFKPEEQKEKDKTILSNDAYAIVEMLEVLFRRMNK